MTRTLVSSRPDARRGTYPPALATLPAPAVPAASAPAPMQSPVLDGDRQLFLHRDHRAARAAYDRDYVNNKTGASAAVALSAGWTMPTASSWAPICSARRSAADWCAAREKESGAAFAATPATATAPAPSPSCENIKIIKCDDNMK